MNALMYELFQQDYWKVWSGHVRMWPCYNVTIVHHVVRIQINDFILFVPIAKLITLTITLVMFQSSANQSLIYF